MVFKCFHRRRLPLPRPRPRWTPAGAQNLKFMMAYDVRPSLFPALPAETAPASLAGGKTLSQKDALASPAWATVSAVLAKKHMTY